MRDPNTRLNELISLYLDRQAKDDQIHELATVLSADGSARRLMTELLDQHMTLRSIFVPAAAQGFSVAPVSAADIPSFKDSRAEKPYWRRGILALAASLIIAAGLVFYFRAPPPATFPGFRIGAQVGAVAMTDGRIATGPKSFCTVVLPDGTLIALNEATTIRVDPDKGKSEGNVQLESGNIYLDVPVTGRRMSVSAGNAVHEVQGTKFLVHHLPRPTDAIGEKLSVFEGRVRFAKNGSGALVGPGQRLVCAAADAENPRLVVLSHVSSPAAAQELASITDWLCSVGIDNKPLMARFSSAPGVASAGRLDLNYYVVEGGDWRVASDDTGAFIRQEGATPRQACNIIFQPAKWNRGAFRFKFRIDGHAASAPEPDVSVCLSDENGNVEACPLKNILPVMRSRAMVGGREGWLCFAIRFMLSEAGTAQMTFNAWPENDPSYAFAARATPAAAKKHEFFALGLHTENCTVEFRDIDFDDSIPANNGMGKNGLLHGEVWPWGEFWPWVTQYYRQNERFVLDREQFTDGNVIETLTPARLKELAGRTDECSRVVKYTMSNGKEGDAYSVENATSPHKTKLVTTVGLPEAFAVEFDMKPIKGQRFLYKDFDVDNPNFRVHFANQPFFKQGLSGLPPGQLDQWAAFRADYFRVGHTETGEYLYEMRLPHTTGSGIRIAWGTNVVGTLVYQGGQLLVSEVRIRKLLPPADLDRSGRKEATPP